jgi:hypothetical protein
LVFTALPRVLDDEEPFCRSCKKPVRKDCSAAVLAEVPVDDADAVDAVDAVDAAVDAVAAVDAADDDVPVFEVLEVLEVPDVLPPRSAINFENAELSSDIALDATVAGAPSAVEVELIS